MLVEGGGADAVQFAASEHWLEHIAGIGRPLGLAGADDSVQFVNKEQDPPLAIADLVEYGLEPFLEFAAVLGPGHQRAHIEREYRAVAQPLGHIASHNTLRQPLDDSGLAHAGLADQHRVVLGLTRENAHHAAYFLIAADHWVELVGPGAGHQVGPVFFQRLVHRLGRRALHPLATAHNGQCLQKAVAGDARPVQGAAGGGVLPLCDKRQRQMLSRNVFIVQTRRLLFGLEQYLLQPLGRVDFGARYSRSPVHLVLERLPQRLLRPLNAPQDARQYTLRLLQQGQQQMLAVYFAVLAPQCLALGFLQGLLRLLRESAGIHIAFLALICTDIRRAGKCPLQPHSTPDGWQAQKMYSLLTSYDPPKAR